MSNHCLKFTSELQAKNLLGKYYTADGYDRTCLDPIGAVYKPTGKTVLVDGIKTDVMADVGGWHCNLVCKELPLELANYEMFPANPVRVWA